MRRLSILDLAVGAEAQCQRKQQASATRIADARRGRKDAQGPFCAVILALWQGLLTFRSDRVRVRVGGTD